MNGLLIFVGLCLAVIGLAWQFARFVNRFPLRVVIEDSIIILFFWRFRWMVLALLIIATLFLANLHPAHAETLLSDVPQC